jgi:type IV pilus assembly protein PilY1
MNTSTLLQKARVGSAALAMLLMMSMAFALDISTVPPALQTATPARTNLMFILDDSTSMEWDYLPDAANENNRCFGFYGFNKVAFNPNVTYEPPLRGYADDPSTSAVNESLTRFPAAVWPTVFDDGYRQSGTTTTLNANTGGPILKNSERYYYTTRSPNTATTTCSNSEYTRVTSLTVAQRQNYANWWSFYRTRMLTMRAGVANAFTTIDATKVRVGFTTISETGVADNSEFLNIRNFDQSLSSGQTQKQLFFSRLFNTVTRGPNSDLNYTPLRPALVKAGRYFANRLSGQTDPVEYSCQRNFSILSTDGYWNRYNATQGGTEPNNYNPPGVDGTAIGNQDGGQTRRPYFEGTTASAGSLADIAMYYYNTDLRTTALGNCTGALGTDVCENNVPSNPARDGSTPATHQRMTTYTIGLGVNGVMPYLSNYDTSTTGAYAEILAGARNWPNPDVSNAGTAVAARIDDVWHAAVNGGGRYFSAGNATDLANNLSEALNVIARRTGISAAASTSALRPVQGDDYVFMGKYTAPSWDGRLEAYRLNPRTGIVDTGTLLWEAGGVLNTRNRRYKAGGVHLR